MTTTKTEAGLDFIKSNAPELYHRFIEAEALVEATAPIAGAPAQPALAAPVDGVAASTSLTDGNAVNATNGKIVTVGTTVYTFKTTMTPLNGEILIGASADATLLNLARAINKSGGTEPTDYKVAAAHATVSASSSVTSHAITLTARTKGAAGNSIALTTDDASMTPGAALLENGVDGTEGTAGQIVIYNETQPYICLADATTATSGAWKKLSVASL